MSVPLHQVLSRKYRPRSFEEVAGQEHVSRMLGNALRSGRLGHAYLFVGPRGVGKTTVARIFARALNCSERPEGKDEPCGRCASCVDVSAGTDLDVVEIDGASNSGVDDVRLLRTQVGYAAVRSRWRIWIVDEVHMLSTAAFNAFLKTLEEPPPAVKFLFCTTEEQRLPETFRSRCQRVEFRPIGEAAIRTRLADLVRREGADVADEVLAEIARTAAGGLRDAESLLEQLLAACPGMRVGTAELEAVSGRAGADRLRALRDAVASGDPAAALDAVQAALGGGTKPSVLLEQWLEALREDLVRAARGDGSVARAARSIDLLLQKRLHLKAGADGALVLEVAAIELARMPDAREIAKLIEALERSNDRAANAPAAREPVRSVAAPSRPTAVPASTPAASPVPESVPPAAPRAVAAPVAAPVADIAEVGERWAAMVEAAGREDARLGRALQGVRPARLEESGSVLVLEGVDPLARMHLARRESVVAFRRAARAVLGREVAPRVAAGDAPVAARPVAAEAAPVPVRAEPADRPRAPARSGREHPKVRLVTDETDGTLLDVRPTGDAEAPGGVP